MLDGMWSFVLVDSRDNSFIAARDPIGITPLYLGWGADGSYQFPLVLFYCELLRMWKWELITFLYLGSRREVADGTWA